MPAAPLLFPPRATYTSEPVYRLSVGQYHDLIQRGTLTADDPVELLEGVLVYKMPKNPPHAITTGLLADLLQAFLIAGWHLRLQEPLTLDDSEPEPDLALVRGVRRDYITHHPGPNDVSLVIEVSDSTLDRDRTVKLRTYARAALTTYWIVNLVDRQVEAYTHPAPDADPPHYRTTEIFKLGDGVTLPLAGLTADRLNVADLLPHV